MAKNVDGIDYFVDEGLTVGQKNLRVLNGNILGDISLTGMYIHMDPICNFKCEGCFTGVLDRVKNATCRAVGISLEARKSIVDFTKSFGGERVVFAGAGEPTLDPNFHETAKYIKKQGLEAGEPTLDPNFHETAKYIKKQGLEAGEPTLDPNFHETAKYIKKQGLEVVTFTNLSTLKDVNDAKKLLQYGPVIGKLYTLNKEKYNQVVNNKLAFNGAIKGFSLLLEARNLLLKESGDSLSSYPIALDSYVSQKNKEDLPDLLRFCRERNIVPYFEAYIELGNSLENIRENVLSQTELTDLFLELQKIDREEFGIITPIKAGSRSYGQDPCDKATHMPSVRENGKIMSCVCAVKHEIQKLNEFSNGNTISDQLKQAFSVKKNREKLSNAFSCEQCSKVVSNKIPSVEKRSEYWNNRFDKGNIYGLDYTSFLENLDFPSISTVVVIGGGNGRNANFFAEKGYKTLNIDSSQKAIQEGEKIYFSPDLSFKKHDIFEKPLEEKKDCAVVVNFLSLFSSLEVDMVLSNIKASIADNGKIVANFLTTEDPEYGIGVQVDDNTFLTDKGQQLIKFYNIEEVKQLCLKHDLSIENIQKVQENRYIDRLGKSITTTSFFVVCSK